MNIINPQAAAKMDWGEFCCFNRRHCVISIAAVEVLGSLLGVGAYMYASYTYPMLIQFISLPTEFLNDHLIIGLINTLAILCAFEFVIGLILFDGARYIRLGQLRFWLTTMFTYKMLTIILVVGMELAGCSVPQFNAIMFLSIFIRFLEMIFVYVFLEEEVLRRMRLKTRRVREALLSNATTTTSHSSVFEGGNDNNNDREHIIQMVDDSFEDNISTNPNPPVTESRSVDS